MVTKRDILGAVKNYQATLGLFSAFYNPPKESKDALIDLGTALTEKYDIDLNNWKDVDLNDDLSKVEPEYRKFKDSF